MKIHFLLAIFILSTWNHGVDSVTFTIRNNCPYNIAPAAVTSGGGSIITGFELSPQASRTINIPNSWSGRIWARFQCYYNNGGMYNKAINALRTLYGLPLKGGRYICNSGDCGSGRVECNGAGAIPPATLAEFTLNGNGGKDFYDVSLVDGFNLPMTIKRGGCPVSDCPVDINAQCWGELALRDGSGGTIGCKSACVRYNTPQFCCTGDHNQPQTCPPTDFSRFFKNLCPRAYSYAYDDPSSTFTCNTDGNANYEITFCP